MASLTDRTQARRLLWLDARAYAERLLAHGALDWLDVGKVIVWQRQMNGLLPSDVVTLDVEPVIAAWLRASPSRPEAMAARRRATYALKVLLLDDALRRHLVELAAALRGSFTGHVLALAFPEPERWLQWAHAAAHGEVAADADTDAVETAGTYIADFLRSFADAGLDAVVMSGEWSPAKADAVRPVQNLCAHYKADCGWRATGATDAPADAGFDFVVGSAAVPGICSGITVPAAFWSGAAPEAAAPGGFRYATVPPELPPETALQRVVELA
ncbi:MAG: hypothetical protein PHP86_17125 [Nevskiales bacterium]|nr:hypothetical protein [Nevskiales bacterium]